MPLWSQTRRMIYSICSGYYILTQYSSNFIRARLVPLDNLRAFIRLCQFRKSTQLYDPFFLVIFGRFRIQSEEFSRVHCGLCRLRIQKYTGTHENSYKKTTLAKEEEKSHPAVYLLKQIHLICRNTLRQRLKEVAK